MSSDQCIVFVGDENYLSRVKALAVNCRREGQWDGDFALITPAGINVQEFIIRGFKVLQVAEQGFFLKFHLFDRGFFINFWKECFYTDCDCLVQRPLAPLFDQLSSNNPLVMAKEVGTGIGAFQAWDEQRNDPEHLAIYRDIERRYPVANELCYNTSCVLWRPGDLPFNTIERAQELQAQLAVVNVPGKPGVDQAGLPHPGGTDQQILNLLLYERATEVQNKAFCYWAFDTEHHYEADRCPIVVHYGRWYAPWIVKRIIGDTPMAALRNERLDVVCHEFYQQNLADFEKVFPL